MKKIVLLKKAAMFGLDARIALAIFGTLSVITGAALYSAIKQAKVIAIISDMKEVEKALEQFMLNTGSDIGLGVTYGAKITDLIKNTGYSGWNGPYLSYEESGTYKLNYPAYTDLYIRFVTDNIWPNPGNTSFNCGDVSNIGIPCYYWITISGISADVQEAIDIYIDGSPSANSGKVRYKDSEIFLKSIKTLTKF